MSDNIKKSFNIDYSKINSNSFNSSNSYNKIIKNVDNTNFEEIDLSVDDYGNSSLDYINGTMNFEENMEVLNKTGATIATGTLSVLEGVLQLGEALVDTGAILSAGIASGITYVISKINGEKANYDDLWEITKSFTSKDIVKNKFDEFYNDTNIGKIIKDKAYGFDNVRGIGNGIGYNGGIIALSAFGGISSIAIAATAGFGKGTADSWRAGANTGAGIVSGIINAGWEAAQYGIGTKMNTFDKFASDGLNRAARIGVDTITSGAEAFYQPLKEIFNKNESLNWRNYKEEFNNLGGFKNVFTQAAIGSIMSGGNEIFDFAGTLRKNKLSVDVDIDSNIKNLKVEKKVKYKNFEIENGYIFIDGEAPAIGLLEDQLGVNLNINLASEILDDVIEVMDKKNNNMGLQLLKEYLETGDPRRITDNNLREVITSLSRDDLKKIYDYKYGDSILNNSRNVNNVKQVSNNQGKVDLNLEISKANYYTSSGLFYTLKFNSIDEVPVDLYKKLDYPENVQILIDNKSYKYTDLIKLQNKSNSFLSEDPKFLKDSKNLLDYNIQYQKLKAEKAKYINTGVKSNNYDYDIKLLDLSQKKRLTKLQLQHKIAYDFNDSKQFVISKMQYLYYNSQDLDNLPGEIIDLVKRVKREKVIDIDDDYVINNFSKYLSKDDLIKLNKILKNSNSLLYTDNQKKLISTYTRTAGPAITSYLRNSVINFNGHQVDGRNIDWVNNYIKRAFENSGDSYMNNIYKYVDDFVDDMDKIIENSPPLEKTIKVYRGCDGLFVDNQKLSMFERGTRFNDKAFVSTSVIPTNISTRSNIVMEIEVPKGTKAAYIESFQGLQNYGQQELLLPRDSEFEIKNYEYDPKTGKIFITARLLESSKDNNKISNIVENITEKIVTKESVTPKLR